MSKITRHNARNLMRRGYVIIFMTMLFTSIVVGLLVGVVNPLISNYSSAQAAMNSKQTFMLTDSAAEEALYRLKNNKSISASETVTLSSGSAAVTVTNTAYGKQIDVAGIAGDYRKNIRINLALGTGISFHYGIQAGRGGFVLRNSSSITGNVFSTGTITGSSNNIDGDVISSGSGGLINGIHTTGTAYAHTIQNSTIGGDAYYVTKTSTTVGGTSYPGSTDQNDTELPISDEQIADWEAAAALGGNATCVGGKYTINSSVSIGPKKIPCNLEISGSPTVIITGHIWVTGNITISNSPTIKISTSLGNQNVAVIADNPSNQTGSGIISINNTTTFQGSGSAGSFVFMISQNRSAEDGGSTEAIRLSNNTTSMVAYAPHGLINLSNSVSLKEATAYKISLQNSANVIYDTGLANSLFSSGPGGGYSLIDWTEI